ncbi:MAG TPA: phage tail protein [Anaerolineaceae bacterium]
MAVLSRLGATQTTGLDSELLDVSYQLSVDSIQVGSFYSLSGGEVEITVIRHPVVYPSGEAATLFIPGPTSFSPITLGRGYGNSAELYNWFVQASNGDIAHARRNGSITLSGYVNGVYKPIVVWDLIGMWPTKLSGFEQNQYSGANTAKLSITLVAESIERKDAIP